MGFCSMAVAEKITGINQGDISRCTLGKTEHAGGYVWKIVKQDSVSDDMCEWHKVKNGNAYKCNTHAEIHDSRVLDWCKCPYCGKKIKVVE